MQDKRRWTLGGLMVLVALMALPMAWLAHEAALSRQKVEAHRRAAEANRALAVDRWRKIRIAVGNDEKSQEARPSNGVTPPPADSSEPPR